jgi:hypothetical protein
MQPGAARARKSAFASRLGGVGTAPGLRRHRPDYILLLLCLGMLMIGLIVVYAISPALSQSAHVSGNYYVGKQLLAIALSLVAFAVTSQLPLNRWQRFAKPLLIMAAAATLLAIVMPVNPNYPAHRCHRVIRGRHTKRPGLDRCYRGYHELDGVRGWHPTQVVRCRCFGDSRRYLTSYRGRSVPGRALNGLHAPGSGLRR